jgi:glutathione peroxidase
MPALSVASDAMSLPDIPLTTLAGDAASLSDYRGKALLVVNVASQCGLTPQYTQLEKLHESYGERGFSVLGFPCNQFGAQEPGTADEIATFCSTNYGVTFPMFAKTDVNGPDRHPLYAELTKTPDDDGHTGDVRWNFEKFLVSPKGEIVARYSPMVSPDDTKITSAIEASLPA